MDRIEHEYRGDNTEHSGVQGRSTRLGRPVDIIREDRSDELARSVRIPAMRRRYKDIGPAVLPTPRSWDIQPEMEVACNNGDRLHCWLDDRIHSDTDLQLLANGSILESVQSDVHERVQMRQHHGCKLTSWYLRGYERLVCRGASMSDGSEFRLTNAAEDRVEPCLLSWIACGGCKHCADALSLA